MNEVYRKVAGTLIFLGATQFVVAMIAAEAIYPGYSVSNNYISDLGVGPAALIFNTSVFLLGAAVVLSAYLIFRVFRKIPVVALFVLTGVGAMGVGVFTETAPGGIHTVASFVVFFFGGLSAIFSYTLEKRPLTYCSVALGALSLVALVLFASQQYLGLGHGGMERMIAYPTLLWGIAFGGHLISYSEKP